MTTPAPATTLDPQTYVWNWFALHAAQRMQLVNFWLVAVAFLAAGFVQARVSNLTSIAVGVCAAGAAVSVAFLLLDRRTRQLIHAAETALRHIEGSWILAGEAESVQLVLRSNSHRSRRTPSYYLVIQGVQSFMTVLFLAAGIQSLFT